MICEYACVLKNMPRADKQGKVAALLENAEMKSKSKLRNNADQLKINDMYVQNMSMTEIRVKDFWNTELTPKQYKKLKKHVVSPCPTLKQLNDIALQLKNTGRVPVDILYEDAPEGTIEELLHFCGVKARLRQQIDDGNHWLSIVGWTSDETGFDPLTSSHDLDQLQRMMMQHFKIAIKQMKLFILFTKKS